MPKHSNPHKFKDEHIAAGYHLQKWVVPKPDAGVIGVYDSKDGVIDVQHLPGGSGLGVDELAISFEDGRRLTVLDEATATEYLVLFQAEKR